MLRSFRFGAIHSAAEQAQAACGKYTHCQNGSVSEEREDGKQVFFSPMKKVNIKKRIKESQKTRGPLTTRGTRNMKYSIRIPFSSLLIAFVLSACGGGSGDAAPRVPVTTHTVTLAWAPNHEKGVNSTGGGYQVTISGQPMITVPYTSGPAAPTSTVTTMQTGTYTATVRAYAALDTQGGSAGSLSAPSQSLTVNVP